MRKEVVFLIIFLLTLVPVFAPQEPVSGGEESDYSKVDPSSEHYSNPDAYPDILKNPNADYNRIDWTIADQKDVPVDRIGQIPTDKVKVTEVASQKELTSEQLVHNSNIDKIDDWDKLSPQARDDALKKLGRIPANIPIVTDTGGNPTDGTIFPNGFGFNQIKELQIGTVKIKNGKDVEYRGGRLTASYVEEFEYWGSTSKKVKKLKANEKEFSIGNAGSVQAGCFLAEDISEATFKVSPEQVTITTQGEGNIVFNQDKSFHYETINNEGTIETKTNTCLKPEYEINKIKITSETNETNETIIANNSAIIEVNPKVGIECINYTPTGQFQVNFKNKPTKDFSFKVWKNNHKICQRKIAEQKLQECNECSIIDYVENKILFNGSPSYHRYWIDGTAILSKELLPTVELEKGRAELFFEKDFLLFAVEISSCKGLCTISPNNYLSIYEVGETFGFKQPHRMLYINPEIKASQSLLTQYRTTYSQAQMEVKEDGVLDYSRDEILVKVLPQQHSMITALTNGLKDRAIKPYEFLLPLAFLLPLLRRKGQVTIFMTFGILILLLVGFVLFFGLIKSAEWETPQTPLQNYITSCLEKTSKATLTRFGAQNNNVFDEKTAKEVLSKSVEQELPLCLDDFKALKEQGVNATECGKPKVQAQVNKEDVLFTLDYCLDEFSNNKVTRIPRLGARIEIKLGNILSSARIMTNSKILVNGKKLIDLEELTPLNYYLYPEQDKIKAITMQNKIEEKTNYWFSYTRE